MYAEERQQARLLSVSLPVAASLLGPSSISLTGYNNRMNMMA